MCAAAVVDCLQREPSCSSGAAVMLRRLLTALLMTLAPVSVEAQEAGLVENVMVFSLVAGLTVGAMAGWLWLL